MSLEHSDDDDDDYDSGGDADVNHGDDCDDSGDGSIKMMIKVMEINYYHCIIMKVIMTMV